MKQFFRILYSAILFGAGILHFIREPGFRRTIPKIIPFRRFFVLISVVFEIVFSVLLWVRKGQQITGEILALFMVAIFQANVYMAVKKIPFPPRKQANPWVLWLRLPLQIPLIFGALKLGRKDNNKTFTTSETFVK